MKLEHTEEAYDLMRKRKAFIAEIAAFNKSWDVPETPPRERRLIVSVPQADDRRYERRVSLPLGAEGRRIIVECVLRHLQEELKPINARLTEIGVELPQEGE